MVGGGALGRGFSGSPRLEDTKTVPQVKSFRNALAAFWNIKIKRHSGGLGRRRGGVLCPQFHFPVDESQGELLQKKLKVGKNILCEPGDPSCIPGTPTGN